MMLPLLLLKLLMLMILLEFSLRVTDDQNQYADDSLKIHLANSTEARMMECTILSEHGIKSQQKIRHVQLDMSELERLAWNCTGTLPILFHTESDNRHVL